MEKAILNSRRFVRDILKIKRFTSQRINLQLVGLKKNQTHQMVIIILEDLVLLLKLLMGLKNYFSLWLKVTLKMVHFAKSTSIICSKSIKTFP